ncbi:MAG: hypothetical protein CMJ35_00635 [Phycisphaerae bacterium]|nr:hypothetical protein [Phycisphaerae bacterium]MBM90106.1 hypothetical protein [Phycisphaerae bacterium]HCT44441.1 hypothetical protein [Phycisphaerales bacterium]
MAARTGASVGVAVTITILGAMSLAFFVTTMIFYGNAQSAKTEKQSMEEDVKVFVSPQEREHAAIRAIRDEATRERKTVVGYLASNQSELMKTVVGDASTSMSELRTDLGMIEGTEEGSLVGLVQKLQGEIESLQEQLATADAERVLAQKNMEAEAQRVADIEAQFTASAGSMQDEVVAIMDGNMQLSTGYTQIEQRLNSEIERLRADFADRENTLQDSFDELLQENILLQGQVARLQGEGGVDRPMPLNEEALVDGRVNQVNPLDNEAIISIGRDKKAILGMTFAIYDDATDIRIDNETGEYPVGKAVVEIIKVEPTFSRARIISSSEGNPIVRGDVIANAVYDPTKTYKFVVDGLFDVDGDGIASRFERDTLEALIERWGGVLVSQIQGDTDFVVLGQKPVLPPAPGRDAPVAAIQEYVRLQQEIQRYDDLLLKAESTSMPVLNANRLRTLIGDFPN